MTQPEASTFESRQLRRRAFAGKPGDLESREFRDPAGIDVAGVFPDSNWADRARARDFVVRLHRFLEPKGLKRKPV